MVEHGAIDVDTPHYTNWFLWRCFPGMLWIFWGYGISLPNSFLDRFWTAFFVKSEFGDIPYLLKISYLYIAMIVMTLILITLLTMKLFIQMRKMLRKNEKWLFQTSLLRILVITLVRRALNMLWVNICLEMGLKSAIWICRVYLLALMAWSYW